MGHGGFLVCCSLGKQVSLIFSFVILRDLSFFGKLVSDSLSTIFKSAIHTSVGHIIMSKLL